MQLRGHCICVDNPGEGAEAIPLAGVSGKPYVSSPNATVADKSTGAAGSQLYLGEYACYGTGGRMMAGMGFILLPGGKHYDIDKKRGGSYVYDAKKATISFNGGFLSGQIGKNVKQTGFQLSETVTAEPWR